MPKTLASQFELTETELKIFVLLQDGNRHTRDEILDLLREEYRTDFEGKRLYHTIQMHISRIRKKVNTRGIEIVCELYKKSIWYRMIRLIGSAHDGS
jgi:DNA-binding response OmpR family regulator